MTSARLKYYSELDGVRAIASLMVMLFHLAAYTNYSHGAAVIFYRKIAVFGQTGVGLFFVLSGFLITRILIDTKNRENYFRNFFANRILRISPLYYLFLIVSLVIFPRLMSESIVPLKDSIYYWIYFQNFAISLGWIKTGPDHFWSLAVEEHFYLFWPFVVYYVKIARLKYIIFGLLVSALLLRFILAFEGIDVYHNTFTRMDDLALGSYLALVEVRGGLRSENFRRFAMGLFLLLIPTVLLWTVVAAQGSPLIQAIKFNLIGLIYFCSIGSVICMSENNIIKRGLNFRLLKYTGKVSYGLYVWHPLCFHCYFKYLSKNNLSMDIAAAFGISYLVATVSFYAFEIKFLKFKKYFRSHDRTNIVEGIGA